jgi:hypothetical protein
MGLGSLANFYCPTPGLKLPHLGTALVSGCCGDLQPRWLPWEMSRFAHLRAQLASIQLPYYHQ